MTVALAWSLRCMTTHSSTQRFLTIDQLCERWSIDRTTLYRFRKAGLPTIRVGGLVRFDVEACDDWFLARAEAS